MQDKLNTRVQLVGWGTIALSIYGVVACGALILAFLGFGGLLAFAGDGIGGFVSGLGFGFFGALIAVFGLFLALCEGLVGLMILNGKRRGWGIGLALGVLGLLACIADGAWLFAAWNGFVVWALATSSRQFSKR